MWLRDPRFHDTKDESDLLHGRLLVVVKVHDQTVAFRQVPSGDLTLSDVVALAAEIGRRFASGAAGAVVSSARSSRVTER